MSGGAADYSRAIAIQPDLAEAYYNRGRARYSQDATRAAIADYRQALALRPDFAHAYIWRGYATRQHDVAHTPHAHALALVLAGLLVSIALIVR